MGDVQADLLLTDAPYNVNYIPRHVHAPKTILNDNMEQEDYRGFLSTVFSNCDSVMAPGASFYLFHAESTGLAMRMAIEHAGWMTKQLLVWAKSRMVLGRWSYHWKHEGILFGWTPGRPHQWFGGRKQTTLIQHPSNARNPFHPTAKPEGLLERFISNSTLPGQVVLDPFAGGGSTVLACERLGRVAMVVELEPEHCDTIRRRWAEEVHGEGCDWLGLTPEV